MNLLAAQNGLGIDLIIKIAIGVLVLVFAIVKQIMEANKQAGKRAAAPGPQPHAAPRPAPAAAGQQADPLRSQVEEFLRRANQNPQANQPPQRPASEIELLVDDSTRAPQRSQADARRQQSKPAPAPASEKRPARRPVTPKRRVTLAERAAIREEKRVGHLAEKKPKLGQRIIQEDEQFDEQLKAKFDHTLGTLSSAVSSTEPPPSMPATPNAAAQIAAMLANPEGVRQAILLNEIMNRPSDRW